VHSCESGVSAAGGEDVWVNIVVVGKFFETTKDVVANSSSNYQYKSST
jgi:hypothetical protein